ncbi:cyclase family protein [Microbaculum sp. FT89]|uniref:cyclase family protein n=1 Tax=Microbaculum sp. FT89 TaxID=3447298 RepID=UPI003F53434A
MPAVTDPATGLQFYELSHQWGHGTPSMPGHEDVHLRRTVKHAQHGVMAHRIRMVMHSGTHLNAPVHLIQKGIGVGGIALDRFFGNGVIVRIPKDRWEFVEPADLQSALPAIQAGDIVVINTGWHARYADSLEYFGDSPGLSHAAAGWLVGKDVKLVAVDTPQVDHPLATSLGLHRGGPLMNRLPRTYAAETGRDPKADFPDWNPAHKALLGAGIPTIENVGGDIAELSGRRATFQCYPWNWMEGDACVVRFVAIIDPSGTCRIDAGTAR